MNNSEFTCCESNSSKAPAVRFYAMICRAEPQDVSLPEVVAEQQVQAAIEVKQSWSRLMRYDTALPGEFVQSMWQAPDAVIDDSEQLPRKNDQRMTVRAACDGQWFVVKRYDERNLWNQMARSVRPSRASQCWHWTRRLIDAGLPTPQPLMVLEDRLGPLRRRSYLTYQYVAGRTLRRTLLETQPHAALVESLAWQMAELWRLLGATRYSHSDANLSNFVVDPNGRLWVIDLDKMQYHWRDATLVAARHAGLVKFMRGLGDNLALAQAFASHLQVDVGQYFNQPRVRRERRYFFAGNSAAGSSKKK